MTKRFSPIVLLPLILAALLLAAYQFLPFVNQPVLSATPLPLLMAARGNNELGIETNGLILIPIVGMISLLLGFWNLSNPQIIRASSALTALLGVILLEYYFVFARDYLAEAGTYLGEMGIGFWLVLALAIIMIAQAALPRPKVEAQFQLHTLAANQESGIVVALVLLLLLVGLGNPRFLSSNNILDVLQGNAYIAVAAIGMSMVIITGNIDISVGSLIGLLAIISGRLVVAGAPVWFSWLAPILVGAAIGAAIGFVVAFLRVPSIVVTLGMMSILKGGLIMWTNGERVTGMPEDYFLAQFRFLEIPITIWFMVVLTILAMLWLRYSSTGRSFYALGGNADAARLSGLSQPRILIQVFAINGVFAGIASVLYATQLSVIQATPPPSLELFIITASVVGGVSILGGKGTVIGSTLAAILLNAIRSGMLFINVSPYWIQAVQGLLILITVLIDLIRRRRQNL